MDVTVDRDELQFRQFQADEIRRQTVALEKIARESERTARDSGTIKTLLIVFLCLMVASAAIAVAIVSSGNA